jgi:hypothetical protein
MDSEIAIVTENAQMCYTRFFFRFIVDAVIGGAGPLLIDSTPEQEILFNTNMYVRLCSIEFNFVGEGNIVSVTVVNIDEQLFKIKLEKDGLATEHLSNNYEIIHFVDPVNENVLNILPNIMAVPILHNRKVVFFGTCYSIGF